MEKKYVNIKGNKGAALLIILGIIFFALMVLIMLYFTGGFDSLLGKKKEENKTEVSAINSQIVKNEMDKLAEILKQLKEKEEKLGEKKKELETKELELKQFEMELEDKRTELHAVKEKLAKNIVELDQSELTNIKKLAKMYSSMKAMDVVKIMEVSSDEMMVVILSRMKEKKSAKIISSYASMDEIRKINGRPYSERAARLTIMLRRFKTIAK